MSLSAGHSAESMIFVRPVVAVPGLPPVDCDALASMKSQGLTPHPVDCISVDKDVYVLPIVPPPDGSSENPDLSRQRALCTEHSAKRRDTLFSVRKSDGTVFHCMLSGYDPSQNLARTNWELNADDGLEITVTQSTCPPTTGGTFRANQRRQMDSSKESGATCSNDDCEAFMFCTPGTSFSKEDLDRISDLRKLQGVKSGGTSSDSTPHNEL